VKLPLVDSAFLESASINFRVFEEAGTLDVELIGFELPSGLNAQTANVLFRLAPTYPDTPPDMWWLIPHLTKADGRVIPATEVQEIHDGRTWQRWSRHLDANSWRSGIDSLESYIRILRTELTTAGEP
jgi:hypothetical protein